MLTPTEQAEVTGEPVQKVLTEREAGRACKAWVMSQIEALGVQEAERIPYGTPAWVALAADDPRRSAGLLWAAEAWREWCETLPARTVRDADFQTALGQHLYEDLRREVEREIEMAEAAAWEPIRQRLQAMRNAPTVAELNERRAAAVQPIEVRAADGWPPVAIPGRSGWYRHLVNGEQVDLPTREPQEQLA